MKILLAVAVLGVTTFAQANHYLLNIYMYDGMGTSGSVRCHNKADCFYQIKAFEYKNTYKFCKKIEIVEDDRVIFTKRYR